MSKGVVIKGGLVINEGKRKHVDIQIEDKIITKIEERIDTPEGFKEISAEGMYVIPGAIDDQVHFREPGLTHKADISSESRAAAAGGITSFMEMPNTVPNTLTQELLENKYAIAAQKAVTNYSFFMGASNDNIEEVLKTNPDTVCGVKVFMGSSTGNMLVDQRSTLDRIFSEVPMLIATHCEDEATIRRNIETYREQYGEDVPISAHPLIRSEEACYLSSSMAVELAKKHNTRLHILHISTAKELSLFRNDIPLKEKRITAEACVHHLWFTDADYEEKGTLIKWNPAVKRAEDRDAIWEAVLDNRIDVIATDHAPHTLEEKKQTYFNAPSGGPLVQHALQAMFQKSLEGKISPERIVEKMCHAPAELFQIDKRGFIREGYYADLVLINPKISTTVTRDNLLYKCGWSPFEGVTFDHHIMATFVNGKVVWNGTEIVEENAGMRLNFDR
ncbi:dihydroorotase [Wandonia haliotis]|uniref:Dihydroorotase n=1 Tax=Wandonia haliotis TaxID=574963 RepID=A0ABN1ML18_9FLAO